VNSDLKLALLDTGNASDASFRLLRNDNISSTKTVTGDTRVLPFGYLKNIVNRLGYTNPALKVVT